jgi:hypothetical protein
MEEGNSFKGAALGTVVIMNGLLSALITKGVLTEEKVGEMLDATLYTIETARANDFPENDQVWADARLHAQQIIAAHGID